MRLVSTLSVTFTVLVGMAAQPAMAESRGYCAVTSLSGAVWWTWTRTGEDESCGVAMQQLVGQREAVNAYRRGSYDTLTLNRGVVNCAGGGFQVQGLGATVFDLALAEVRRMNWQSCTIAVSPVSQAIWPPPISPPTFGN
jgi:hypothetical protein